MASSHCAYTSGMLWLKPVIHNTIVNLHSLYCSCVDLLCSATHFYTYARSHILKSYPSMTSWETCAPTHTHRYHPPQQVKICSKLSASSTATHIHTHAHTHTHTHTHNHTHTHTSHTHHLPQQVKTCLTLWTCLTLCNWVRREVLVGTERLRGDGWWGDRGLGLGGGDMPTAAPSPPEFLHLVLHWSWGAKTQGSLNNECTWHHKTFLVQLYWHLVIKLYCTAYCIKLYCTAYI